LWTDFDHSTITFDKAPNSLLEGGWTYMSVARYSDSHDFTTNSDCTHGGGFKGMVKTESVVSICCANHMGRTQVASSERLEWTYLRGESLLEDHDHAPDACTFFEAKLQPGKHQICCANGWASGIFMARAKSAVTETTTTGTTTSVSKTSTTNTALGAVHSRVDELEALLEAQKGGHDASAQKLKQEVALLTAALKASEEQHSSAQAALDELRTAMQAVVGDLNSFKVMAAEKYIARGGSNDDDGETPPTSNPMAPGAGVDGGVCSTRVSADDCTPAIQTLEGGIDITVSACCGSLRLESSACTVDPCETADDVAAIKRALGLP